MSFRPLPSGLVTFMFTDIVGSTAMKGQMSGTTSQERQQNFLEKIKAPHETIIRESVGAHGGSVVKSTGDGFFIAFSDAEEAVLCGVEIQQRIAAAAIVAPGGTLQIRIGLNSGQAAPHEDDYTASAADKAARIESKAKPGAVYISRETHELIRGKLRGITIRSAGVHDMKDVGREQLFAASADSSSSNEGPVMNGGRPQNQLFTTSISHNLPRLQPFFGREEELRRIAGALEPMSPTFGVLIDGSSGMGKTSLAVRAAYDASPDDFHRIIFVSLKTRELDDDGERDLSGFILSGLRELYNEIARELGREDITKLPEDQRPRLLLDALRNIPALLVLDNLESLIKSERDQLFTFVKRLPSSCKAILTARGRLGGTGAEELILERLDGQAALATLADLATHNPILAKTSETERLALHGQAAGNPLLLRWTAGQLGRGHCLTFADALQFLRSCPPGNDPLEFVFGDLVNNFSEAEAKAISVLTYFNLPAKAEHIAPIAKLVEEETDFALRQLANRSLTVPNDELKTFTIVPLISDFLRKKRPEVIGEIGDRLADLAFALVRENGYKQYDRFPILDAAWPRIAPALPLFLAGSNDRLQIVCTDLHLFFEFTGRWDEWLSFFEKAEAKALSAGDYANAGWRAYEVGWVHKLRMEADAVVACAERASRHWDIAKANARDRAFAVRLRGVGYMLKEDYSAAAASFRDSLAIYRSFSPESEDVAIALADLGAVELHSGDLPAAEKTYLEALRVARAVNYTEGVVFVMGNLAQLALTATDWTRAEAFASQALPLAEKLGRQELIASNCCRLAAALAANGKEAEGLPYARRALEIYTTLDSPHVGYARAVAQICEG